MQRITYVHASYHVVKRFNFRLFMDGIGGYMTLIGGTLFLIYLMYIYRG
jgi:hypothetical protein